MVLFQLDLNMDQSQIDMVNDIVKYTFILIITHIVMNLAYNGKSPGGFGLTKNFLNQDFMSLLMSILIAILAYWLLWRELVEIS